MKDNVEEPIFVAKVSALAITVAVGALILVCTLAFPALPAIMGLASFISMATLLPPSAGLTFGAVGFWARKTAIKTVDDAVDKTVKSGKALSEAIASTAPTALEI